jgi:hypothetical protein
MIPYIRERCGEKNLRSTRSMRIVMAYHSGRSMKQQLWTGLHTRSDVQLYSFHLMHISPVTRHAGLPTYPCRHSSNVQRKPLQTFLTY